MTVLVIEDETGIFETFHKRALRELGYTGDILHARTIGEAEEHWRRIYDAGNGNGEPYDYDGANGNSIDLVIMDNTLDDGSLGVEFMRARVREGFPGRVFSASSQDPGQYIRELLVEDGMKKPLDYEILKVKLSALVPPTRQA